MNRLKRITVLLFSICLVGIASGAPFKGEPLAIPGTIEVEDFDTGGEGVSYHDEEETNQGGVYRTESVDLDTTNGRTVLGWTIKDEWINYSINVQEEGQYIIKATVASGLNGSAFSLKLDGKDITGKMEVPNTGSFTTFTTIQGVASFTSGKHTLKLYIEASYCNIDKIEFQLKNPLFSSPNTSSEVVAGEKFTVAWNASEENQETYNLNWVSENGESFLLKENVAASDKYEGTVPESFEGDKGYYTLSKMVDNLIPSDFDGVQHTVSNPLIWADVPDVSTIRVGDTYYMASTTMHMNPGVPIMASKDLVRWRTINYAHQALANSNELNMTNGKNAYGKGSWASCIRYKDGTWYVLTPSYTTGKSHIFKTNDILSGEWQTATLPFYHDPSLILDDDGRIYVVYGSTNISIVELSADAMSVKGTSRTLLQKPASIAGSNFYVECEGTQVIKKDGYYYIFLISWPSTSCRSVLCYRSKSLTGNFEGKVLLQDNGVAQGGIVDTPDGQWYGTFFRDNGSVGRIPYLLPVTWQDNWPMLGVNKKVPSTLNMPAAQEEGYGMVTSDDFEEETLPLEWQWNHNPVASGWSLKNGALRLTNIRTDADVVSTQNTLTQRSFGPNCSGWTKLNTTGLKDGDCAGLVALQDNYGFVGVKVDGNSKSIVMRNKSGEVASVPLYQNEVWLRIDMNFVNQTDKATFFYSTDGKTWNSIGNTLSMKYELTHFMGYRYGLFNFGTKNKDGYADFDFFKIGKSINSPIYLKKDKEEVVVSKSIEVTIINKSEATEVTDHSVGHQVFPNPTTDYVRVDGIDTIDLLELVNLNGIVETSSAQSNLLAIPSHLCGTYLLRIHTKTDVMYEKIIVR